MYVTFSLWSLPYKNAAFSTFYLLSCQYCISKVFSSWCSYIFNCVFHHILNTKATLSVLISIIAASFCIFVQRILKHLKGATCESRQRITTLDRRAIFFFVRSRHVLRTSVIRHQGRHVSRAVTCCRKCAMTKSEYPFTETLECILLIFSYLCQYSVWLLEIVTNI